MNSEPKKDVPAGCMERIVRPLYSMQRCKKDDTRYGKIHFAHHEFETLCGLIADSDWWILTNRHDGDATCEKCIKTNTPAQEGESFS